MANFAGRQYYTLPAGHLPLPPETDHDASHTSHLPFLGADSDGVSASGHYLGLPGERSRLQPRRTSTLSYQNSVARDVRDRGNLKSLRNLVVVLPPPDFPLEQGHLGHVLSMGPRHRLSQGILMPLFPSMFGQLNAIAREYNFPSTIGLCLYLHINENGITMTPRISDDSWQYLFGYLFDARPASNGNQSPISGSIEFDIDLNKARWFGSWVSGTLRDPEPAFPPVARSPACSVAHHWRGESRTTNTDEQPFEDRWDVSGSQTLVGNSRPETFRHLPRKLSLVDRLEPQVGHSAKAHSQPNSPETHLAHSLSPIPQSAAIPQTANSDLERRVNTWRESTELFPVSMTEAYQPAADIGIPSVVATMDEYALDRNFRSKINLDEYHWSVTSAGPIDTMTGLPVLSPRLSSVHIDRRANGSVPLTPATATSWGPGDDEWHSVISNISRLPSPDLAERIVEDPEAPRVCAVWGNSFGWRTATTWQEVYPYSGTPTKPVIAVQLRDPRGIVSQYPDLVIYPPVSPHVDSEHPSSTVRSVWGSSFGWQSVATWREVWPYSTVTQAALSVQFRSAGNLEFKYPNLSIYPAVYPSLEIYPPCAIEDGSQPVSVTLKGFAGLVASYPNLVIYPVVYPHLDIYPLIRSNMQEPIDTKLFSSDRLLNLYPNVVIYPAVYPHFDLYPKALDVTETVLLKEVAVSLVNAYAPLEYPSLVIYPTVYPYLDIYPAHEIGKRASSAVWGLSFEWKSAKTWLNVYPIHATKRLSSDDSTSIVKTTGVVQKQAVWGTSFGWNDATTWRMVWPTTAARMKSTFVQLAGSGGLLSENPYLVIYPAAYPYFDRYPTRVDTTEVQESQAVNYEQHIALVPQYPNLTIYAAAYPHLDIYPPFSKAMFTSDKGRGNHLRRRIETWRARTAAQISLAALLANNHEWDAEEPLELSLGDYAWSATSTGPSTSSPLQFPHTPHRPLSVHLVHRLEGSVLLTPSTATSWGPHEDDGYSDIASIERLPSPDIAQRVFNDPDNPYRGHQPWRLVWPFLREECQAKTPVLSSTISEAHYPNLDIYPAAYPHFDLYPTRTRPSTSESYIRESLTGAVCYPVLDIYPAVYPYFNIYPSIHFQIEAPRTLPCEIQDDRVHVRLPAPYPNLDIYPASYPYNLDCIYSPITVIDSAEISVGTPSSYPWLVVDPPVYPFVCPYSGFTIEIARPLKPSQLLSVSPLQSVSVRLPGQYPTFDFYPAGYPWSLQSIYPAISVQTEVYSTSVALPSRYPSIEIYPTVYPFVQPYPQIAGLSESTMTPGSLDKAAYTRAQGLLALAEYKSLDPYPVGYPHFDLYPMDPAAGHWPTPLPRPRNASRRERKTHMELHVSVFRSLEKQPAQQLKTHVQLHDQVFQDGVAWTPSGYIQDSTALTLNTHEGAPAREQRRRPPPIPELATMSVRPSRSRSGTLTKQSPDTIVFPLGQPAALPPMPPLRVRSPGVSSQPSPVVSEIPTSRISPSSTHSRITSFRLSQAVKSIMPGVQRRNSSAALGSPPADDQKERAKDHQSPTRFLSMVDRRPTVVPPLPTPTLRNS